MSRPMLQKGDYGPAVLAARQRLDKRGYDTPHPDGEFFGQHMLRAVARFQRNAGLEVDGIIGPKTWAALTHRPGGNAEELTSAEKAALVAKRRVTGRDGAGVPDYNLGAEVPNLAVKHPMVLDCSELVQWAVYQAVKDVWVDGSYNQYPACRSISVEKALRTVGALVFITGTGAPSGIHHVGIVCQERGKFFVAQARSAYMTPECGIWPVDSQTWHYGGLIRELSYR